MKRAILLGPPKPPAVWPVYVALGLIWSATVVGAWAVGIASRYELAATAYDDARAAQTMAERCLGLSEHLLYDAERATYYVQDAGAMYREMIDYADMVRGRVMVAEAVVQ